MGASLQIASSALVVLLVVVVRFGTTRGQRLLVLSGLALSKNPRRSIALARLGARRAVESARPIYAFNEAHGLLWTGRFAAAVALLDARVLPASPPALGCLPIIVKLEALLLDRREETARALYEAHREALSAARASAGGRDVVAIRGMLAFHEGDLATARAELERASHMRAVMLSSDDPILRAAAYFLAAIAHREGRADATPGHLRRAIARGGDTVIVRWALAEWQEHVSGEAPPATRPRPKPSRRKTSALSALRFGLAALILRTDGFVRGRFDIQTILGLAAFNAALNLALRGVDYTRTAEFLDFSVAPLVVPISGFFVAAHIATGHRRDRDATYRVLAGTYATLPLFLIGAFAAARVFGRRVVDDIAVETVAGNVRLLDHVRLSSLIQLGCGVFVLVVFLLIARRAGGASRPRAAAAGGAFLIAGLLPVHLAVDHRLFWTPRPDDDHVAITDADRNELMFHEVEKVRAVEAALAPERPGVADLWFVGAAGWADQDVFHHEMESAKELFDTRFDTRGHSIFLTNDRVASDQQPMAATSSLRHVLNAVASRMDVEDDVLFLTVTSHGSEDGLALRFPARSPYQDETLRPNDLRAMLDESGIRWRVILLLGCHSGVFVETLRNDHTLIATAAARDRVSYGCVGGNPFTDFGRAVFAEQLRDGRSFPVAFRQAAGVVKERETAEGVAHSMPQISEGAAIGAKLAALESGLPRDE